MQEELIVGKQGAIMFQEMAMQVELAIQQDKCIL